MSLPVAETATSFTRARETRSGGISCAKTQWALHNCAWGFKLDRDGDGFACDRQCAD